jgi:hypothetical protein
MLFSLSKFFKIENTNTVKKVKQQTLLSNLKIDHSKCKMVIEWLLIRINIKYTLLSDEVRKKIIRIERMKLGK